MSKTKAFGIDVSHYQVIDWDVVAPNIDFAWCKSSEGVDWKDPSLPGNIQALYDHNVPAGIYHYFLAEYYTGFPFPSSPEIVQKHWPSPADDLQLQNFLSAIRYKKYYMLAIDLEETGNKGIDPLWMAVTARLFAGRVQDWLTANKPDVPLFIYSRNTYIAEYAPHINDWIHLYNSWIAQWTYNSGSEESTWAKMRAFQPEDAWKPKYFSVRPTWEMCQWSGDRFILPGIKNTQGQPRTVDLDIYNGTKEQLYSWIKFTPGTTVPEPPDPGQPPAQEPEYITRAEFEAFKAIYAAHTHGVGQPK